MSEYVGFNLNDYVRVRVTQAGFAVLRAELFASRFKRAERIQREQEENGGWSKWQLWELMSTFGPSMHLGCDPPFETTIELRQAGAETR